MAYVGHKKRRAWLWLLPLGVLLAVYLILQLVQTAGIHGEEQFRPDYPMEDLGPILEKKTLTEEDYDRIFTQTGLARPAVEALLAAGGEAQILETQRGFFQAPEATCVPLLPARFTCEDLLLDEAGEKVGAVPLAPLRKGDILLTFGTHSIGWRHGHGGLVVDTDPAVTLEATVLGSDSAQIYARHWPTYANFLVLRVRDADDALCEQVAEDALTYLDGIPYSLLSGIFGPKAPDIEEELNAQCAYLPWYAWKAHGVDLDSDGGKIVTIMDLAESPELEVVQVCGIDPRLFLESGGANS